MGLQQIKRVLIAGLLCLLCSQAPPIMGQAPPSSNVKNLFSTWAKLSLIGYSQSEIESALEHVDPKMLAKVRHRMRMNVIKNLRRMNLRRQIDNSTTEHDLRLVIQKIRTEVRFAGLENDRHLLSMLRNHFGIPINLI